MNSTHQLLRSPTMVGVSAERALYRAPRFVSGIKIVPAVVTSNRAFIRAWVARRAKLAALRSRSSK